eukprot:2006893-Rhodomonas_salina.2
MSYEVDPVILFHVVGSSVARQRHLCERKPHRRQVRGTGMEGGFAEWDRCSRGGKRETDGGIQRSSPQQQGTEGTPCAPSDNI